MITRRQLLASAVTGAAAAVASGGLSACEPDRAPAIQPVDPADWASVRAQFRLNDGESHFAAFVLASHPAPVQAAIERHRAGLDADPHGHLAAHGHELDTAVAEAAASYLDTSPDQIAFTDSTTMGLGLLYSGLRLRPGDEVLTTEHDFYSTHESLRLRQSRDGISVRRLRLYEQPERADAGEIASRIAAAVSGRTRVVAVTWVHSGSGVKLPVRAIADALAGVNADRDEDDRVLLCVDGVHGFGVEDASPEALGCDFLVSGCHKWLFGPRGTGLIWGRREAWARFTPVIPAFDGDSIGAWLHGTVPGGPPGSAATPGGYHSFEHRWALAEAFELHRATGRDRIARRTHDLATALKAGLGGIAGVTVRTPGAVELSSGIVCCEVAGHAPPGAVAALQRAGILTSTTPYATAYLRLGTSIVTDESDVEAALRAMRSL
jgi:selenocysteine lyase/cysteine desulfurase